MGSGNLSKRKKPSPDKRIYNVHGIQYIKESEDSGLTEGDQEGSNGVQRKLIREYSTVNGFQDVQWINAEYPFENIVLSGGGSKGYA